MPEPYRWNQRSQRYHAPNGRFVPERSVRAELDRYLDRASARIRGLTTGLQRGSLDLAAWQEQMRTELKSLHVNAATLAHGGRAQMAPADYLHVGRILRQQYDFLGRFAAQIADGSQPLDGRLLNRASLYSEASRATFEQTRNRDQRNAGRARFERNVLHAAESCAGCLAEQARGWVPLGRLTPVGARRPCLVRCRCTVRYSEREGAA